MTQKQIAERNKQIALMLGLKPLDKPYLGVYQPTLDTHNSAFYHDRIEGESWYIYPKYDVDWNYLMEAVSFINKTHNQNNPHRDLTYTITYLLNGGWWGEIQISRRILSDTEQLFLAVSDFAKLYNEGKL
jgi:hypothetical protein